MMYVAMMETDHYTWTAAGATADDARAALVAAWNRHIEQVPAVDRLHGGPFMAGDEAVDAYGCRVMLLSVGEAYCDDSRLVEPTPAAPDDREPDPRCPVCVGHGAEMDGVRGALELAAEALDYLAQDNYERARKETDTDAESDALRELSARQVAATDTIRGWLNA